VLNVVAGRKREFDKEEALKAAMLVFWEKGYAGASLAELTASMDINKPSLYAAFGNKEQLHRSALELYGKHYGEKNLQLLKDESKSVGLRLGTFLESVARMQFDKNLPTGCLVSSSVSETASGTLSADTIGDVKNMQVHTENMLIEFFDSAKGRGELGKDFNSKDNAVLVGLLIHGSAIMARSGKSIDEVRAAFALSLTGLGL
jgi:AcrR family transcriptional regulator